MILFLLPQTDTVCLGNAQESLRNETPCLHGSPAGNPWSFLYDYYTTPPCLRQKNTCHILPHLPQMQVTVQHPESNSSETWTNAKFIIVFLSLLKRQTHIIRNLPMKRKRNLRKINSKPSSTESSPKLPLLVSEHQNLSLLWDRHTESYPMTPNTSSSFNKKVTTPVPLQVLSVTRWAHWPLPNKRMLAVLT